VFVATALALAAALPSQAKLKVGDPAPPLKVMKWVKGTPVTSFKKGNLYVVEFWATWCGPCRISIPHITTLAAKYKGKITFSGIDLWEQTKSAARLASVTKFVKEQGTKMAYNVGMDDDSGTMAKTWMAAAGQNGIPTAFVIGKNGHILWIGHPMELDTVLDPILKGKFDARAAAAKREKAEAEQAAQAKLLEPISKAVEAKDFKGAVDGLDKLFATHPDMESQLGMAKAQFLFSYDEPAGFTYEKKLAEGIYKDDAARLNSLAWIALDDQRGPKVKDYPTIVAIAEQANTVAKGADPSILDTLAKAYAGSGDTDKAIATQQQAVDLLDKKGKDAPDAMKKQFADKLTEYKNKKAGS
jgi:thiol-disulfide isomerase/thioredoxin